MRGLPTILPTTKQVVGNGHLQTDLDGKNKKALYLQANNRASKTFLDGYGSACGVLSCIYLKSMCYA